MDSQTLAFANLLLFLLYAAVMVVHARFLGGSRSAVWYAGANVCQSLAMSALLVAGAGLHSPAAFALSGVLLVAGMAMLHRSFAELLERARLLWTLQIVLLLVVAGGSVLVLVEAPAHPVSTLLVSATLGVQAALTASALFSFAGEGVQLAGIFAGVALCCYSLINLMRVAVALRYGSGQYRTANADMDKLWLIGCLLANAAAAFGFMFISAAKLRLELLWRAQIDELTGLLNRWAFKRIATRETLRSRRMRGRLAVVSMDLDGMKGINDRLGHSGGDAVLQAVSSTLQAAVRDRDSIARMGGDEFCILLPDTELGEAVSVAERLRSQIDDLRIRYREESVQIRASFGVSSSDRCGWEWQNLLDQSDEALYRAKRAGNRRVIAAEAATEPRELPSTLELRGVSGERRRTDR